MDIKDRFFVGSKQSFFLFGPRGTGKSTWIGRHYPNALMIDLLEPDLYRAYTARPERLRDVVAAHEGEKVIVVDEIQKIPGLLDVIHLLIEKGTGEQYILTGSSARKIKRADVDLLAGRAVVNTMHPFMAAELGDSFSLDVSLKLGMLPLVLDAKSPEETLRAYVTLYLNEEVRMEGLVRSIDVFSRFLESASFYHGAVLNMSDVARDCQVGRKAVEGYFSILEDLLLAFRLPVFSKRAKRNLSSHPKFYFFDAGVFRSIRPTGPLDVPSEIEGAALEGMVAQHLRAWSAYGGERCGLYFWRTKSGNEIDFVVYGKDTFCAIEVKNTSRVNVRALRGLSAFQEDYPEARTCLLYRGRERIIKNGIPCIACEAFLKNLRPGRIEF